MNLADRRAAARSAARIGFEEIENLPHLAARYADTIITQVELALWALKLEKPYTSTIEMRRRAIRTNRRYIDRVAETLEGRRDAQHS